MDNLKAFSFRDATMQQCPISDMENAKSAIHESIEKLINAPGVTEKCRMNYSKTKETMNKLLETLFLLFQSPNLDEEEEIVESILTTLDSLRLSWLDKDELMKVYGNYILNVSCIPTAIAFQKHLQTTHFIHNNQRMTRITLENEYKLWIGRIEYSYKFSHILFALSWMNFLRVQNNSNIQTYRKL